MSASKPFILSDVDDNLLLHILQKLNAVEYVRMRRTCKRVNNVAEKYKKSLRIPLFRINISPKINYRGLERQDDLTWRKAFASICLKSPSEIIFRVRPHKEDTRTVLMTMPQAKIMLAGFVFDKVITGQKNPLPLHTTSFMTAELLGKYMEFLKERPWRTRAAAVYNTPLAILNIIKPPIIYLYGNETKIPPCVKTVVVSPEENGYGTLNIRKLPPNVQTLITDDPIISTDDLGYFPRLIQDIAKAFYDDELSVSHIQHKKTTFYRHMIIYDADEPAWAEGAAKVLDPCCMLQRALKNSPYAGQESQALFHTHKFPEPWEDIFGRLSHHHHWISTSNMDLTSKSGKKGLLALRQETDSILCRKYLYVSLYFWKCPGPTPPQHLQPTFEYPEVESDGVEWRAKRGNILEPNERAPI